MSKKSPNPIDIQVGANVRSFRLAIGMSQEKLAAALGLTFQQVQKYEKGTNRISASKLVMIAEVLGVNVTAMFSGVDGATVAGTAPPPVMNAGALTLARRLERLPLAARRTVQQLVGLLEGVEVADEAPDFAEAG